MQPPPLLDDLFPDLPADQRQLLERYAELLLEWNKRVNLISRKNTSGVWTQHIIHSLMIAKVVSFAPGQKVMDVGTGGGLPGIPLAILHSGTDFCLVDSIGKKAAAVQAMIDALGLKNARAEQRRAEAVNERFDFIVSRAVTRLPAFHRWVGGKVREDHRASLPSGILYIKGGDFNDELKELDVPYRLWNLSDWTSDPFFETKKIVWLGRGGGES